MKLEPTESETSLRPTNVRLRIVWISVLMAFGLYLTRVSLGEIVKTESFLKDPAFVESPSTRFSVELKGGIERPSVAKWITENVDGTVDLNKVKLPFTVADHLTKSEAEGVVGQLQQAEGDASMRISKSQLGDILGAFFFSYALFQVPAGWFSDRLGARKMLALYILAWSLLTFLTGWASSLVALMFARLFFGFAQAGAYPTSSAVVRRWFPVANRGRASALISFGGRLGATLAPLLTITLILNYGWRSALWCYGIAGIGIALGYYWIVRDRPEEHPECNQAERDWIGGAKDERLPRVAEVFQMLGLYATSRSLWLNSLGQFCINIGWAFLITWLPTYLKEVQKVPEDRGAWLVTGVLAMGMVGQLVGGRAADWSVRRFGLRMGRVLPITVANYIAGVAYLGCFVFDSLWVVVACCAIVSMMTDVGNPSIWAFMQDVGGKNTGAMFGWANMWGNLGASVTSKIVPILLAYGANAGSGQGLVFLTCASAFFVAGTAALGMDATKPLQANLDKRA